MGCVRQTPVFWKMLLDEFLKMDEERRKVIQEVEDLKCKKNESSKKIGELIKQKADVTKAKAEVKELSEKISVLDEKLRQVDEAHQAALDRIQSRFRDLFTRTRPGLPLPF